MPGRTANSSLPVVNSFLGGMPVFRALCLSVATIPVDKGSVELRLVPPI